MYSVPHSAFWILNSELNLSYGGDRLEGVAVDILAKEGGIERNQLGMDCRLVAGHGIGHIHDPIGTPGKSGDQRSWSHTTAFIKGDSAQAQVSFIK
jgi:hypothetical protein